MKISEVRVKDVNGRKIQLKLVEKWDEPYAQEAAFTLLKHVIETGGKPIRYHELAKKVSFECSPRNIDRFLGALSFSCIESGLPPVSVIVVNEEGLPGDGFFKAYYSHIKDENEKLKKCIEQMKLVEEYNYWDVVLELFTGESYKYSID